MSIQDEALAGRVIGVLSQDKRLSGLAIMVRAANGEIYLKGRVDNEEQKELAATIVLGVPGISGVVTDELVVREAGE